MSSCHPLGDTTAGAGGVASTGGYRRCPDSPIHDATTHLVIVGTYRADPCQGKGEVFDVLNRLRRRAGALGITASVLIVTGLALAYLLISAPRRDSGVAHGSVPSNAFPDIAVLHGPATSSDVLPSDVAGAVMADSPAGLTTSRYSGRFADGTEDIYIVPNETAGHVCIVDRSLKDGTIGTGCGPVGNGRADAQPVIFLSRPASDGGELLIMGVVPDWFTGVSSRAGTDQIRNNTFAVRVAVDETNITFTGPQGPHVVDVSAFHTPVLDQAPKQMPPDQQRALDLKKGQAQTPRP